MGVNTVFYIYSPYILYIIYIYKYTGNYCFWSSLQRFLKTFLRRYRGPTPPNFSMHILIDSWRGTFKEYLRLVNRVLLQIGFNIIDYVSACYNMLIIFCYVYTYSLWNCEFLKLQAHTCVHTHIHFSLYPFS